MSAVQLPDELQRVIEQQVAEGRAASPAVFLEQAVLWLIDATSAEEADLRDVVGSGSADIESGRFTTVASPEDERRLWDGMAARLRSGLSAGG